MVVAWTIDEEHEDERDNELVSNRLKLGPFYLTYIAFVDSAECLYIAGIEGTSLCLTLRSW